MVQAEGDAPRRYRMLETLKAYARGRLDERAQEAAAQRHAAHLARLAAEAAARVGVDGAEAAGEAMVRWPAASACPPGSPPRSRAASRSRAARSTRASRC